MKVTYSSDLIALGRSQYPAFLDQSTGEILTHGMNPEEIRAWIRTLTDEMLALPSDDKREFEVKHTFLDGVYMRELFIPKGSFLIGKVHKLPCLNIVSKGDISVITESGSARVKAGYSVASPAGIQKVGYAHEDTVFVNVFRTDETDLSKMESAVSFDSYSEQLEFEGAQLCL